MTGDVNILLIRADCWRLGISQDNGCEWMQIATVATAEPTPIAAVLEILRSHHVIHRPLVLALPSQWCLCTTLKIPEHRRSSGRNWRQAMTYRLEEELPIVVENYHVDFMKIDDHSVFSICADRRMLDPITDALTAEGILLAGVSPTSLLVIQQLFQNNGLHPYEFVLWQADQRVEQFTMKAGLPTQWTLVDPGVEHVARAVQLAAMHRGTDVMAVVCSPDVGIKTWFEKSPDVKNIHFEQIMSETAVFQTSRQIVDCTLAPWIDLRDIQSQAKARHHELAAPITRTLSAIALILLCLAMITFWRGSQYGKLISDARNQQQVLFHDRYPNQQTPAQIKTRLEAELRRLRANDDPHRATLHESSITMLCQVLKRMPGEVRYQLTDIDGDGANIILRGRARTHGDANVIAAALQQSPTLNVTVPQTNQTSVNEVSFNIQVSLTAIRTVMGQVRQ